MRRQLKMVQHNKYVILVSNVIVRRKSFLVFFLATAVVSYFLPWPGANGKWVFWLWIMCKLKRGNRPHRWLHRPTLKCFIDTEYFFISLKCEQKKDDFDWADSLLLVNYLKCVRIGRQSAGHIQVPSMHWPTSMRATSSTHFTQLRWQRETVS